MAEGVQGLLAVVAGPPPAHLLLERPGQLHNVGALVAAFRDGGPVAQELLVARPDAPGQKVHLAARVVVVELPVHLPAGALQERADGVAQGRLAAVAQVQGPGGVGADPLHHDGLALPRGAAAVPLVLLQDEPEVVGHRGRRQAEVQEARAGHLHAGDAGLLPVQGFGELLGDLTGSALQAGRQRHGHVRGPVAVGRVPGTLDVGVGVLHAQLRQRGQEGRADAPLGGRGGHESVVPEPEEPEEAEPDEPPEEDELPPLDPSEVPPEAPPCSLAAFFL